MYIFSFKYLNTFVEVALKFLCVNYDLWLPLTCFLLKVHFLEYRSYISILSHVLNYILNFMNVKFQKNYTVLSSSENLFLQAVNLVVLTF